MSEPMEFWRDMECSGVRSLAEFDQDKVGFFIGGRKKTGRTYIGVPSCGLKNLTPSSVIVASFNSETI